MQTDPVPTPKLNAQTAAAQPTASQTPSMDLAAPPQHNGSLDHLLNPQPTHYFIRQRHISNWATGGFLEWQLEQDTLRQNRIDQDDLVDNLRRQNASELSEVDLQPAATRLSQILVQEAAQADHVEANLGSSGSRNNLVSVLRRTVKQLTKIFEEKKGRLVATLPSPLS